MSTYGICQLTLIPMRKGPTEASEMISQLLFGETFEILESKNSWSLVRTHDDQYEGWISTNMLTLLNEDAWKHLGRASKVYLKVPVSSVSTTEGNLQLYLAGGSTLMEENDRLFSGNHHLAAEHIALHRQHSTVDILGVAMQFLHVPYLWGGRTIFGIDCSGFTQIVYKMNGILLPRDAYQQATVGKSIDTLNDVLPGDLAFFGNDEGRIVHTGIIIDNSHILHALGKVHIGSLDSKGILNPDKSGYTHFLTSLRRVI